MKLDDDTNNMMYSLLRGEVFHSTGFGFDERASAAGNKCFLSGVDHEFTG